jgi:hypothetical protein
MGQCGNYIHHTDYNSLHWSSLWTLFTTKCNYIYIHISYSNTIKIYIFDIVFFMIRDILPKYVIICKYARRVSVFSFIRHVLGQNISKPNNLKVFWGKKSKGPQPDSPNGHLWLRMENLSFNNTYMYLVQYARKERQCAWWS